MIINTGKANVSLLNKADNIIVVDIYTNGELGMNDVNDIHEAIGNFDVTIPVDTICVKSGKNYLSHEAFEYSINNNCLHNQVIYVIKHMQDIHFPSDAQETYFKDHLVDYCSSIDEAYHLLKKNTDQKFKHCPS
ncbi:MAG: hypothetical protein KZQ64_15925 [gamma proteobacterium symbiont of Bathyaustriella thionipta]|nr:hypothetical protein [gamma proteobacterium symbiont of Bathyaustriella thionipta]MCU7950491.1 hypothetical protein [gamma proteobacterium symbiont of Bathyaustriella thionipta]MCU7954857.1 hypothetical protein [gamma proteobacterium symbiont of Bathyaustriella thionipta]MCU7958131.1 hypothetical protein [gamma proteobacterium symbiont of Bathyaustriella thionipta]MCU7967926.1 hypothetical protein [gamma proteobacterium symbiont of Bathyaustriella thionipta]